MIDLGTLGGETSVAIWINDRGQVLGSSTTASGESHLFLWQKGVMIDLWPWHRTPSGGYSLAWAMHLNARGEVVGPCITADDELHACIRQLESGSVPP
jgi:probable HAF family extracellular repeat protein